LQGLNGPMEILTFGISFELFCFGKIWYWSDVIWSLVTRLEGDISSLLKSVDYAATYFITTSLLRKCKANLAYKGLLGQVLLPKMNHLTMHLPVRSHHMFRWLGQCHSSTLMNVMLVCPATDVFIGSVDTTSHKKTKEYIAEELKTYIEVVGPNKLTQICSDNASAILGTLDELVALYPYLYKQGCCAHILDLLLKDWEKEECSRP
jgi:hypothetical protein